MARTLHSTQCLAMNDVAGGTCASRKEGFGLSMESSRKDDAVHCETQLQYSPIVSGGGPIDGKSQIGRNKRRIDPIRAK